MQPWFVEYASAIADGERTYLDCTACDAVAVPPRTVCPDCGRETLEPRPLSETAEVAAHTQIHHSIPAYSDETPYTVVIARFEEGVYLTGQLRDADEVERDQRVRLDAERRDEDAWLLTFSPVD